MVTCLDQAICTQRQFNQDVYGALTRKRDVLTYYGHVNVTFLLTIDT